MILSLTLSCKVDDNEKLRNKNKNNRTSVFFLALLFFESMNALFCVTVRNLKKMRWEFKEKKGSLVLRKKGKSKWEERVVDCML